MARKSENRGRVKRAKLAAEVKRRRAAIAEAFLAKRISGLDAARALSDLADWLLTVLLNEAAGPSMRKGKIGLCLVAAGGFGRRQLAFHSDIDVMVLSAGPPTRAVKTIASAVFGTLWDLGFNVGHSLRTPPAAVSLANKDLSVKTALLDARLVAGDEAPFKAFGKLYRKTVMKRGATTFVEERLDERDRRHQKMGDSRYLVEPNLKESKGGLRDLHNLYWIARFLYGVRDLGGLAKEKILRPEEVRTFERAEAFLWNVRQHLHLMAGRPEDRLTFDVQVALARALGYRDRPNATAPERFMKHYFWHAKNVGDLTRIFCAFLEARQQKKSLFDLSRFRRAKVVEDFRLEGGRLTLSGPKELARTPAKLVKIFAVADRHGLDIHPDALRHISRSLHLIDDALRRERGVNAAFLEVLTSRKDPETNLRRMNEAGVLGRLVPDFGRVVAQTQHDMYHHYTVDEHTIRAVGLLARIEKGELEDAQTLGSQLVGALASRQVLYLALFLHDIAKGRGCDHSEIGEAIARELGPRVGFTAAETELAGWLVKNHLLMSWTAFKRDLADPKTIRDFTAAVGSLERLQLLTLLTIPDIMAVGPKTWNGWKHRLLSDLYALAKAWFAQSESPDPLAARAEERKAALTEALPNVAPAKLRRLLERLPEGFWISDSTAAQAEDAKLVLAAERKGEKTAVAINTALVPGFVRIAVFAPAHPALLHRLSGALAFHGVNIADARAFSLSGTHMLASFVVEGAADEPFASAEGKIALSETLADAARGEMTGIRVKAPKPLLRAATAAFPVEPRLKIDNQASAAHTVLEVKARDRVGLLYDLTGVLTRHGCAMFAAHIATYGARAADVFYVQDRKGRKITDAKTLQGVKEGLEKVLRENERLAEGARGHAAA
jgi:[protein-PII] uridylyltransferase